LGRSLAFGALGVLLALVVAAAGLEIGLRIYSRVTPNADVEFYRYASLMKGAAEGSGVRFLHQPGMRLTLFGVDVSINSRGFRDVELPAPDEPNVTRIALIGDSITFGWGVPYGKRFSELLEEAWSRDGHRVELINTGHGNWNSAQEYAALSELLADQPLDGVIQVWYINDAEPTPVHRAPPWYARLYTSIFLWSKSDLLRRRLGDRETYVDYYRGLYGKNAPGRAGFEEALARTGEWTRERGIPWVFVILPEFHEFPGPFVDVFDRVKAMAEADGAIVVDATEAFHGVDPATIPVAHNDVHPNAKGHAIIARAIEEQVDPAIFHHPGGRAES